MKSKLVVKKTDVLWLQQRPRVFAEIARLMGFESANEGTQGWFSKRMTAMGNIIAGMEREELAGLEKEVERIAAAGFEPEERMR